MLRDAGQSLLLLLMDTDQSDERRQTQTHLIKRDRETWIQVKSTFCSEVILHSLACDWLLCVRPSHLCQLSLAPFEGLYGVLLQSIVLQHRAHVVHATHGNG